jgi:hypothetical protein
MCAHAHYPRTASILAASGNHLEPGPNYRDSAKGAAGRFSEQRARSSNSYSLDDALNIAVTMEDRYVARIPHLGRKEDSWSETCGPLRWSRLSWKAIVEMDREDSGREGVGWVILDQGGFS